MNLLSMHDAQVRLQLERILANRRFANAEKLSLFLRYIVETTLLGEYEELKESVIGVKVFGRRPDYDPKSDSTVRVEAGKLRARLAEYYEDEGALDPLGISIPKGSYRPEFATRNRKRRSPAWVVAAGAVSILAILACVALLLGRDAPPAESRAPFLDLAPCDDGMLLAIHHTGDLFFYRHRWKSDVKIMDNKGAPLKVGNGWGGMRRIGCAGEGRILGVEASGRMLWYRTSLPDGPWLWDVRSGTPVDNKWNEIDMIAFAPDGAIYGKGKDGALFESILEEKSGIMSWRRNRERLPGNWGNCRTLAAAGQGVLYCLAQDGTLTWHLVSGTEGKRILDRRSGTVVAKDWKHCSRITSAPEGVLYCLSAGGELIWNRRPVTDPGTPWEPDSGTVVGGGFYLPQ